MNKCKSCGLPTSDHEAGRGLDKCIAEMLGWTEIEEDECCFTVREPSLSGLDLEGESATIPEFSTDIGAAMGLLMEMVTRDYIEIECMQDDWKVLIGSSMQKTEASTAALAICRAYISEGGG